MLYFFDMDGCLAEYKFISQEAFYEEGFFKNLKPNDIVWPILKDGLTDNIYVLSTVVDSPYCIQEKNAWLDENFPVNFVHRMFVPKGMSKADYVRSKFPNLPFDEKFCLVDDYNKNLRDWRDKGGYAVKYLNGINHKHGSWDGEIWGQKKANS